MSDIQKVNIKALAGLARLEVSDAELATLEKEIPDILKFVEQIQNVASDAKPTSPELRNVLREDKDAHESGIYTERLLKAAPKAERGMVVVKQVVSRRSSAPPAQEN